LAPILLCLWYAESQANKRRSRRKETMLTSIHKTATLGELIAAVFDNAAQYSTNPREVSRLAKLAVQRMLQSARRHDDEVSRKKRSAR
jgi:hypothetical protein